MLARRALAATDEANELERLIAEHVRVLAPALLDEPGVGAIVAAQLLVAWSHHGRLRSEAAFARLAGVAPLPASSGLTTRHRLSRGGDRQLNRALHTVILQRRQDDAATKDYIARRVAEGKSTRDAVRMLKRYLARPPLPRHAEPDPTQHLTDIGASFRNSMSFSAGGGVRSAAQTRAAAADSIPNVARGLTVQRCVAAAV